LLSEAREFGARYQNRRDPHAVGDLSELEFDCVSQRGHRRSSPGASLLFT